MTSIMKFTFNYKHTLFHFLGLWFFGHAIMIASCFENLEAAETIRRSINEEEILKALSLSKLAVSMSIAFFIGYLIALIIAFIVSSRIKGTWINTLVAFILFFTLIQFNLTAWNYLKKFFLFPGSFFNGWPYYAINVTILILIGIFFLFGVRLFYTPNKREIIKSSTQNV